MANCGQRSRMAGGNMSIDIDELWTTAAVRFQLDLPPAGWAAAAWECAMRAMRGGGGRARGGGGARGWPHPSA
eukprot:SAG25_NODE_428_length_8143_cov_4.172178_1_plen_72_part_10